jgi:hypothetical protein
MKLVENWQVDFNKIRYWVLLIIFVGTCQFLLKWNKSNGYLCINTYLLFCSDLNCHCLNNFEQVHPVNTVYIHRELASILDHRTDYSIS